RGRVAQAAECGKRASSSEFAKSNRSDLPLTIMAIGRSLSSYRKSGETLRKKAGMNTFKI
ncbi:hypothetical protein, partial [Bacillus sp. SIMBA_005]|uniref:hypothetical protein n=1 Tax=Bacillus sp. SIMBA_005 TaxID=3085754 RepID=UPI00397E0765